MDQTKLLEQTLTESTKSAIKDRKRYRCEIDRIKGAVQQWSITRRINVAQIGNIHFFRINEIPLFLFQPNQFQLVLIVQHKLQLFMMTIVNQLLNKLASDCIMMDIHHSLYTRQRSL